METSLPPSIEDITLELYENYILFVFYFLRGQATNKKKAFREAFGDIASLRSFLKPGTPLLALTATVEHRNREALMKLLGMHEAKIINVSVNNDNIRFSAKDVKKGLSCFNWLVDEIGTKQEATPKTIIFCRSIYDVSVVLSYLLKKLGHLAYMDENKSPTKCLLGVYHSNSPTELKERVRKSFKNDDGPIRVVIATSALSLGVNFKDITYVIHYGPAPDLRSHLQEAGRAGRNGRDAYNITFYHGQQLRLCDKKIKTCLKVDTCLRVALFKEFVSTIQSLSEGHRCCHNCHKICKCGGERCNVQIPAFEGSTADQETGSGRERNITAEDENDLKSALFEIQETLNQNIAFPVLGNTVIAGIVSDASHIFDVEYLIENHNITSMQLARDIIEICRERFEDIDISADTMFCQPFAQEQISCTATDCHTTMHDMLFCDYFDSSSDSEEEEEEEECPVSEEEFDDVLLTL